MIDREAAGSRFLKKGNGSKGNYEEPGIITNKTIVYMVIVVLIAILCIVYVFQLKKRTGTCDCRDFGDVSGSRGFGP